MFDLGWGKLVVIALIALVVIGPKELPAVLRTVGQWMTKIRRMAAEFQGQFQEAMREAEMAEMKKHVDEISDAAKGLTSQFDPLTTAQNEIKGALEDKPATSTAAPAEPAAGAAAENQTAPVSAAQPAMPDVDAQIPLPEPLPPVTEKDL